MKKKPGPKPTLRQPNNTYAFVLYDEQIDRLDRVAASRGISRSQAAREALDLFLAVNMEIIHSGQTSSTGGTPA